MPKKKSEAGVSDTAKEKDMSKDDSAIIGKAGTVTVRMVSKDKEHLNHDNAHYHLTQTNLPGEKKEILRKRLYREQ